MYRVKLNNLGHINISSIKQRLFGRGEGSQWVSSCAQPINTWIQCGHSKNFLEILALGKCKVHIYGLGKFRSVQGFISGSKPQNYDDILRKLNFWLQCSDPVSLKMESG
jgi:hypothetical protein